MAKILITDKISPEGVEQLSAEHDVEEFYDWEPVDLLNKIKGFDALVIRSRTKVTKELMDSSDKLRVVARAGAGLDNVDCNYAKEKGILVLNTPTANLLSAAELTVGLAMALLRHIPEADQRTRNKNWKKVKGLEVSGKKWGMIGFGNVGQLVAGLITGFKCEILAYDPFVPKDVAAAAGAKLVSLDEVMKQSDIISIHLPLLDATRGIIGEKELGLMSESAIIINTSRGGIIKEEPLYKALKEKKILGAALDVFETEPPDESPLLKLDNTVFTCHMGAQTLDAQERVGQKLVEVLLNALK